MSKNVNNDVTMNPPIKTQKLGQYLAILTSRLVNNAYTAISRKVVGKNVHATISKGNTLFLTL